MPARIKIAGTARPHHADHGWFCPRDERPRFHSDRVYFRIRHPFCFGRRQRPEKHLLRRDVQRHGLSYFPILVGGRSSYGPAGNLKERKMDILKHIAWLV